MRNLMKAAQKPREHLHLDEAARPGLGKALGQLINGVGNFFLGPRIRFAAGAVLLLGCLLWLHQNNLLEWDNFREAFLAQLPEDVQKLTGVTEARPIPETKPLQLLPVPATVTDFLSNFNAGVAGLLLILATLSRGWVISFWIVPCAVVAWVGPALGIPDVGPWNADVLCMAGGFAAGLLGLVVRRVLP
jgi:hypothetical protein